MQVGDHANLYQFWGNEITESLGADMGAKTGGLLINCASQETYCYMYFLYLLDVYFAG